MALAFRFDRSLASAAGIAALMTLGAGSVAARDVPYVPTPNSVVQRMLEMVEPKPEDVMYDLGSGDGRIVITAIREFGVQKATGIDIDPQRIEESVANAKTAGVADRATFKQADIFETDFSDADVITMYLLNSVNMRLRPRLLDELKPGTRLVSHQFSMQDWKADAEDTVDGRPIYYWVVPAKVEGAWRGENGFEADLKQQFQVVTGTVKVGGRDMTIESGRLKGEELAFAVRGERDGKPVEMRFKGRVSDPQTLEGELEGADGPVKVQATKSQ